MWISTALGGCIKLELVLAASVKSGLNKIKSAFLLCKCSDRH